MKVIKIILFPFWPFIIGWKLSKAIGLSVTSSSSVTSGSGCESSFLGSLVGSVIVGGLIYFGVFMLFVKLTGYEFPQKNSDQAEPKPALSAEVAK